MKKSQMCSGEVVAVGGGVYVFVNMKYIVMRRELEKKTISQIQAK